MAFRYALFIIVYEVKNVKKIIGFIAILAVFIGGSYFAYNYYYGGDTYYTKIVTDGERSTETSDSGETFTFYDYDQAAYDQDGAEKDVTLHESRENPLRKDAYLKLLVNERKGVISWEEVSQDDVPDQALTQLN